MLEYRIGTVDEAPQWFALSTQMLEGTNFAPPAMDKVQRFLAQQGQFRLGVWDKDKLIAFMAGYVSEPFMNHEVCVYDQGLYVSPQYRGGSIAANLVGEIEKWARTNNASRIWLSQSVGHKKRGTLRFFERQGYTAQGYVTCKNLQSL